MRLYGICNALRLYGNGKFHYFRLMKIALTGHTGFLGSYLKRVLLDRGVEVLGLGRGADSDWHLDLRSGVNDYPRKE